MVLTSVGSNSLTSPPYSTFLFALILQKKMEVALEVVTVVLEYFGWDRQEIGVSFFKNCFSEYVTTLTVSAESYHRSIASNLYFSIS